MALGVSFIPNQSPEQQKQQPSEGGPPLQQALQMLSLRVPRFGGVNALAPDQLIHGRQPGAPLPGTPEWEELMRRLMGGLPGQPGQQGPMGQPPGMPPTNPNVIYKPPPVNGGTVTPDLPHAGPTGNAPAPQYPGGIGQVPGSTPSYPF